MSRTPCHTPSHDPCTADIRPGQIWENRHDGNRRVVESADFAFVFSTGIASGRISRIRRNLFTRRYRLVTDPE